MHHSFSPVARTRRRATRVAAAALALSLLPLAGASTPVDADAPAVAVTGLERGARGDAVKTLQQALVNQGIEPKGGVDGIFGPGTEQALKDFQASNSLTPSGVVDDATALALGLASSELLGLSQGTRGAAVSTLQQALVDRGIRVNGGVDGMFGPGTKAAVTEFQRSAGLADSGVVDAATAAALGTVQTSSGSGGDEEPADEPGEPDETAPDPEPAADDTAAPASDSPFLGLKIGARGSTVRDMQQLLLDAGFNVVGGADGIFGVLTANALSSFQNSLGYTADAVVDERTAAALDELVASSDTTSGEDSSADAPGPNAASPLFGLRYCSLGSDVKQLQQALIDAGIRVRGGADGVFGPATQAALEEYQANKGLPQSGIVDDATAGALASGDGAYGAGPTSPLLGLRAGALGNSVKALQEALIDAGVRPRGGADGIFGPATANAVKEFQRSQGLEATGVADEATVAALANPKSPEPDTPEETGGFAAYGEKGSRVVALQSALVKAGIYLRGGVDGSFGGGTSAAVMDFQRQNGLSVSGKVGDATAEALGLERAPAPAAPDASSVQLDVFPMQGPCHYGDTWLYPRSGGRKHQGVDIIGSSGNLLYAVADGRITKVYRDYPGSLAGNGLRLTVDDGTYYFYAHLSELAEGIEVGVPVRAGQVIGYNGSTGNSGTAHLHFEIHPKGGSAINPYPYVKAIDACDVTEPLPQG